MSRIRVGVLRGGPSVEHEVSIKTGENVLRYLPKDKYEGVDIVLQKDGQCLFNNSPQYFQKANYLVDVVFNALHGYFGEDGKVQQILNNLNLPYTGSGALSSSIAMNKVLSRDIFAKSGLKIPRAIVVKEDEPLDEAAGKIFRTMNPFWVVKPASGGSSIGVTIARNFPELVEALENAFRLDSTVIVEEYIKGREVTCGVLENFRDEEHYVLPVIEIIPPAERNFFDYECKYDGSTSEICPVPLDFQLKKEIEDIARQAHRVLGCANYSRTDMIVSPRPSTSFDSAQDKSLGTSGVYLLEINTLPGLTSESLLPKSAEAVGCNFPQLLDHIIELALNRNKF